MKRIKFLSLILLLLFVTISCKKVIRYSGSLDRVVEDERVKTFEHTKAYNEGTQRNLMDYYVQYTQADSWDEKAAIASVVRMTVAGYDLNKISSDDLRSFVEECINAY